MPTYQLGLKPARGVINVSTGADLIFVLKKQSGKFPEDTSAQLVFDQSKKIINGDFTDDTVTFRMEYAQSDLIQSTDTWRLYFRYNDPKVSDTSDDYCIMYGTVKRYS